MLTSLTGGIVPIPNYEIKNGYVWFRRSRVGKEEDFDFLNASASREQEWLYLEVENNHIEIREALNEGYEPFAVSEGFIHMKKSARGN